MRPSNVKLLFYGTWAWAVPALTSHLEATRITYTPSVVGTDGALDLLDLYSSPDQYAHASFQLPCAGCLGQDGPQSLIFSLKVGHSSHPCGQSNVTLNGHVLEGNPGDKFGNAYNYHGKNFEAFPDLENNVLNPVHQLSLDWNYICLTKQPWVYDSVYNAFLLRVTVKSIDGKPIDQPPAFAVSFNHTAYPPKLLRLEPKNVADTEIERTLWREPPSNLRLGSSYGREVNQPVTEELPTDEEIDELEILQSEADKIYKKIFEKKKAINAQLRKEAQSISEELAECNSTACALEIATNEAGGAVKQFYVRLLAITDRLNNLNMGKPEPYAQVWRADTHSQAPQTQTCPEPPMPPPPSPPPPAETVYIDTWPCYNRQKQTRYRAHPALIVLNVVLGVLCCGLGGTLLYKRCHCAGARKHHAPDCPTIKQYDDKSIHWTDSRRPFWRRFPDLNLRDKAPKKTDEEKQSLIQPQDSVLENAMQEEIRQLRAAHGVVNSLIQFEENRASYPHHPRYPHQLPQRDHQNPSPRYPYPHPHDHHDTTSDSPYSPTSSTYASSILSSRSRSSSGSSSIGGFSRTNSLPDYTSETSTDPPAYESDEDRADIVANGFREYMPESTSTSGDSVWTAESSVVDVSPRPSAETLRYAEVTDTGVGDDKKMG